MTAPDALVLAWHELSDHARDGAPFGSPICNCEQQAERVRKVAHLIPLTDDEVQRIRDFDALVDRSFRDVMRAKDDDTEETP